EDDLAAHVVHAANTHDQLFRPLGTGAREGAVLRHDRNRLEAVALVADEHVDACVLEGDTGIALVVQLFELLTELAGLPLTSTLVVTVLTDNGALKRVDLVLQDLPARLD